MRTSTRRHVYITGFMGTGKSTVGTLVADRLRRPFYDLDAVVENIAGHSINTIFVAEGEAAFRNYESRALRSIVNGSASVIALGGGSPTVPSIARLARYTGHVAWLTADWPTVWERVRSDSSRPLLAEVIGADAVSDADYDRFVEKGKQLLETREPAYHGLSDWSLDTSDMSSEVVADRIIEFLGTSI